MVVATNMRYGTTQTTDILHVTGGLRGQRAIGGWLIGPLFKDGLLAAIGPVKDENFAETCRALGESVFGADDISMSDPLLPARVWRPLVGPLLLKHQPADSWSLIVPQAMDASDAEYASLARNLSMSLRAAGIRLRDTSDEYHRQLVAGLVRRQEPGRRFQNVAISDLHLACHSLLSEMGSARDYLAAIVANQIGAPSNIDALSRLTNWIDNPAGRSHANNPTVSAMLDAWDKSKADPWLYDLTEYRNVFLHREPLGANNQARWLSLIECESHFRKVFSAQMLLLVRSGSTQVVDGLTRFANLHGKMCRLADFVASHAK